MTDFCVVDQERHGVYRVHRFLSFAQFRLWALANHPKHMRPLTFAAGSRLWPDADHTGEFTSAMMRVEERQAQIEDVRAGAEAARRESVERRQRAPRLSLAHNADVDLVALAERSRREKEQRRAVRKPVRSASKFLDWCITTGIDPNTVPAYLGCNLGAWTREHPDDPFGSAIRVIVERRDYQAHPSIG